MNKQVYTDFTENALRLSEFEKFSGNTKFHNLAAKFVVAGQETYHLNGKKFTVNAGEYIIGNSNHIPDVEISTKTVGLCLDISRDIISEIISETFNSKDLEEFIMTDKLLINTYNVNNTHFGSQLNLLSDNLTFLDSNKSLSNEFFYEMGESFVHDQALIFKQISRLEFKKQQVNEDVFRNLFRAKNYMDECFLSDINLDQLIDIAYISKFAFIRLFKQTFGSAPYNYIKQKRLTHALKLL